MTLVFKNDGKSTGVTWSGDATAVIFRDAAGRMVGVLQPGPATREQIWLPLATSAEVVGDVRERSPGETAAAEVVQAQCLLLTPARRAAAERVSLVAQGQRAAVFISAAIFWAVTGVPAIGNPLVGAAAVARAWSSRGRALVQRSLTVVP